MSFIGGELRLPSHTEWHRVTDPVMPIRNEVYSACGATNRAHRAPADARPWLILGEGVQPEIDQPNATVVALDIAGNVAVREPIGRTARRVAAGHFVDRRWCMAR